MRMSDVFKLPMLCEDGDGFIYSKDLRHSIQFDGSDVYMMDHKKAVTHAINNHDRMADEIAELRDSFKEVKSIALQQLEFRLEDSECGMCEVEEAKDSLSYKIDSLLAKHK